jgi:hypothetical protein
MDALKGAETGRCPYPKLLSESLYQRSGRSPPCARQGNVITDQED